MSPHFATSTMMNAAASVATIAGGFITTVIVARLLGPEAVGVVAYAAFIVTISLAILDMGMPGMLMRFIPDLQLEGEGGQAEALIRFFFLPYVTASALYSLGLFLLLDPAVFHNAGAAAGGRLIVAFVAAAVFVQSLAMFFYGTLKGRRRFGALAKVTLISALLQLAVAWAGSLLFGLTGALAAPVAGFLLGAALAVRSTTRGGDLSGPVKLRSINFAWRIWGTYVLTTLAWSRMEVYFLKHSWGDHAAGLFAAGLNLANLALQTPMLLTGALVPFLVLKRKSEGNAQFLQSYTSAVRYFAMLVLPACFGAAAVTPVLLPMIFGPSFQEAVPSAMILIVGASMMTFLTIAQQYALAVERTSIVLWLAALGATCAVISGLTLIPLFGTIGAAAGRLAAQTIVAMTMLTYVYRLGWHTPYRSLAAILIASVIAAAAAGLVTQALPDVRGVFAAIGLAVVLYAVLCKYLRVLPDADLAAIDDLIRRASLPSPLRSTFVHTAAWLRR